ncbi:hypothetical protein [Sodalis ligni]|jgi:hypothetical protein|nr:hypothetical protein [Sodalis ligni]
MAKSASERQAAYRERRAKAGDNGERRINTWVSTGASLALSRLAARQGISQREMLERLIIAADKEVTAKVAIDTQEWDDYFLLRSDNE